MTKYGRPIHNHQNLQKLRWMILIVLSWSTTVKSSGTTSVHAVAAVTTLSSLVRKTQNPRILLSGSDNTLPVLVSLRGGGTSKKKKQSSKNHKKPKKKTKKSTKTKTTNKSKTTTKKKKNNTDSDADEEIKHALKEKDAAQVLGDAIRSRGEDVLLSLRNSDTTNTASVVQSVGWAMGASDYTTTTTSSSSSYVMNNEMIVEQPEEDNIDTDTILSGGVEAAPSAVVAHYFLKSHGGAHALQCVCSALAVMAGWLSFVFSSSSLSLQQRCLVFAMIKHVSGLMAASALTAKAIPDIGYRQARIWMETLVQEPVTQYLFYTACIYVWLSAAPPVLVMMMMNANHSSSKTMTTLTKNLHRLIQISLVGPVLVRESISTLFVLSDVLVLWTSCNHVHLQTSNKKSAILLLLKLSQSMINIIMNILVTPSQWKQANPAARQAILAKLTSKCTLLMEVLVGILLFVDAMISIVTLVFGNSILGVPVNADTMTTTTTTTTSSTSTPNSKLFLWWLLIRILCTRVYGHFLWIRRRKINHLATSLRGGASQLPFHVLDLLLHPIERMGLDDDNDTTIILPASSSTQKSKTKQDWTWKDITLIALGIDE